MMQTLGMSAAIGVFFGRKHDKCPPGRPGANRESSSKKREYLEWGVT